MTIYPMTKDLSSKMRNMSIVCAFFVVLYHCYPEFDHHSLSWVLTHFIDQGIIKIALPYFFLASGFFILPHLVNDRGLIDYGGYGKSLKKRLLSLGVPYVLWMALFYLFGLSLALLNIFVNGHFSYYIPTWAELGLGVDGALVLAPMWYLRDLLLLVLISPLLLVMLRKCARSFLVGLFLVYFAVCPWDYSPEIPWWGGGVQGLTYTGLLPVKGFFYFTLGMALRGDFLRLNGMTVTRRSGALALCIGLVVCALFGWCRWHNLPYAWHIGFCCVPFLLFGIWTFIPSSPWPSWLVACSFPIYLMHKFFLVCLNYAFSPSSCFVAYIAAGVLAFGLSIVMTLFIRRAFPRIACVIFGGR